MNLEVTNMSLDEIKLPDKPLKEHPERQVLQIAESIRQFGFNDPVAIDEKGEIIEGVGRVLAARELGMTEIPVISLLHLSESQKMAYCIAHNKTCLNSDFNLERLRTTFDALAQLDEQSLLAATGFLPVEINDLLAIPELPELSEELTEHMSDAPRIICPHCGENVYV